MKTSIFNLRRVGLLFQRYFIERFRSELMYWGLMAIVFMFMRNNIAAMSGLIIVAGVFYASRFFKEIHHSGNGVAYFMIPATQLEKLTVAIVMTTLYYFVMMMVVYIIGNLAGTFLNNVLNNLFYTQHHQNLGIVLGHVPLQWKLFEETSISAFSINQYGIIKNVPHAISIFNSFLLYQALFLFGGIYFKNKHAFKTFSAWILFSFLFGILLIVEARLILGELNGPNMLAISQKDWESWKNVLTIPALIFYYLLPPFFWVVSYFRLTEKQV